MTLADLPRMLFSDTDGWQDVARWHPSVARIVLLYVVPMSLIPPVMFLYAALVDGGAPFPTLAPSMSMTEGIVVATVFFLAEIGMVMLMGTLIRDMGELVGAQLRYEESLLLAAIVPTPLWIASLALFVPSLAVNLAALALAWVCCAALIYHGVPQLFHVASKAQANILARHVLVAGVLAWIALMVLQAIVLSMVLGWR